MLNVLWQQVHRHEAEDSSISTIFIYFFNPFYLCKANLIKLMDCAISILTLFYLFIYLFIHLFIYLFIIYSFIYSFIHSFIHLFIYLFYFSA